MKWGSANDRFEFKSNGFSYSQADPKKKSPKYKVDSYCGKVVMKTCGRRCFKNRNDSWLVSVFMISYRIKFKVR